MELGIARIVQPQVIRIEAKFLRELTVADMKATVGRGKPKMTLGGTYSDGELVEMMHGPVCDPVASRALRRHGVGVTEFLQPWQRRMLIVAPDAKGKARRVMVLLDETRCKVTMHSIDSFHTPTDLTRRVWLQLRIKLQQQQLRQDLTFAIAKLAVHTRNENEERDADSQNLSEA